MTRVWSFEEDNFKTLREKRVGFARLEVLGRSGVETPSLYESSPSFLHTMQNIEYQQWLSLRDNIWSVTNGLNHADDLFNFTGKER